MMRVAGVSLVALFAATVLLGGGTLTACSGEDGAGPGALASPGDTTSPKGDTERGAEPGPDGGDVDATEPDASEPDLNAPAASTPMPPQPPPQLAEHIVAPKDADSRVTTFLENEYAYVDGRVPQRPELILWLVGAGGVPAGELRPLKEAAAYGIRAVSVRYVNNYAINGTSANDVCNTDPDPDCHGKVRLEALEGKDHSTHVTVPPENSIEVRLGMLLKHLGTKFPAEGWGAYVDANGVPRWSSIFVAGTSHGASAAGRISKVRSLAGAVMASGPFDHLPDGSPAAWQSAPSATPVNKVYFFTHSADTQYAQDVKNVAAMGLPGAVTAVDGKPADWGGSHRLTSSRAGGGHGSTSRLAGNDGYPTVWKTMLRIP